MNDKEEDGESHALVQCHQLPMIEVVCFVSQVKVILVTASLRQIECCYVPSLLSLFLVLLEGH